MAAILHQSAHHTPAYWWRGEGVIVRGLLGGHGGQRPMGKFGQDGILMTTESQDLGLTSHPKDNFYFINFFGQYSVSITILGC